MISEPSSEGQIQLHYRELAEYLPDSLLFILDRHLDVVFAGGSLLAKSRWPRDAIAGMPLADLMPPGVYAQAEPHLRGALGGQEQSCLLNYPTGEAFDVRAAPLPGEDGTTPHVLVVAHDITAHKHAQESQRLLEKRLRLAIQAVNVGLWDWDLATNRVHYSREWKRQLGYAEDEIGEDFGEWEQRVHPADLARARSTALTYVADPWPNYEQEYRMRHKDGTYRWILTRAALVYNEDGRAMRMLGSHIDITEKKRAELAVAESERFARATLDGLSAHIAIVDAAGTIVAVNRAWREFAAANRPANPLADLPATGGLSEGANYVAVCRAAVAAGCTEAQLWLDAMQAVLGGAAELVDFEYPCHSPHEQRWFVVRISRMPGDVPPRLVIAHENITRRKLIELEREELLHRLHHQAEQMVQVMYSVPEGVLVLDSRRHVLLANKHAEANLALLATFDLEASSCRSIFSGSVWRSSFTCSLSSGSRSSSCRSNTDWRLKSRIWRIMRVARSAWAMIVCVWARSFPVRLGAPPNSSA